MDYLKTLRKQLLDKILLSTPSDRLAFSPFIDFIEEKKLNETTYLEYIKRIAKYNIDETSGSKYWKQTAQKRNITKRKINAVRSIEELLSLMGDADYSLLQSNSGYTTWYKPKQVKPSKLFQSFSSGTTGQPKMVMHHNLSLFASAINEYVGISASINTKLLKNTSFLSLGPFGAYQKAHEHLSSLLSSRYVDLGFDTKGIKLLSPDELKLRINQIMLKASLEIETGNAGILTGTPDIVLSDPGVFKSVQAFKFSGVGLTTEILHRISEITDRPAIPSYGHFAGMASIGFDSSDSYGHQSKITYYPPFPFTNLFVVNEELKERVDYGQRGRIVMIVAKPELFLIKSEDYAVREKPKAPFHGIDGISDVSRSP